MKKSILTLLTAFAGLTFVSAQEKTAPQKEYTLELSASTLEVKAGESKDVSITLNRSKAYSKSKAVLGLSSGLPQGVTVTFEPAEGVIENSVAKISVAENAKAGNYLIILNSRLQNKSKGATLKLVVMDAVDDAVSRN